MVQVIYKDLSDIGNNNFGRVFLVRGKGSFSSSGAREKLANRFDNISAEFYDFSPNPKVEDVLRGIELYKKAESDTIVSVGGGSVMDMAKLIRGLASTEYPAECIKGNVAQNIGTRHVKHVAVPTTSGSGSEATHFAVVYIDGNKYSFVGESVLPDVVVLDPSLTYSMPPGLTAATGMDALSQAMESYWSVNSNEESLKYSRIALKIIWENLERVVNNPNNTARQAMLRAANLAGKAIAITKTTAPHALSYKFTSDLGLPHGHATGLTLGEMLEYNAGISFDDCVDPIRGPEHYSEKIREINDILNVENASEGKREIKEIMEKIGLRTNLPELTDKKIAEVIGSVNIQRLKNNPRRLRESDMTRILQKLR